ncbi:GNAT family N-acetyltransferase [Streptomyces sp. N2-109]|uniref:GNAT family N-acetyltransferase n=1 Tax=Streptomyces gossypii TaxID=2883101 RepID=A0ABT2K070_9ACTN|nr:GNAT family N-acetyltransferase [Streptomyces gossypii]MCT2592930.1 GNAT family N-acetyltransferase [Streptomyces gossypii]
MSDTYEIRETRGEDWRRLKELRLAALADPVSDVAFYETHEAGLAQPDSLWQQRAAQGEEGGSDGRPITTLVAEVVSAEADGPADRWAAMLVVYVEGSDAWIVAVYTRPEHRGAGLGTRLFRAAQKWAWSYGEVERLLLHVHETNDRARDFYQQLGFVATGESDAHPKPPYGHAHVYELKRRPLTRTGSDPADPADRADPAGAR